MIFIFFMKKLPKFLWPFFWDTDPKKLDVEKRSKYIIERVMDWGDIPHVKWMLENFSKKELKNTLIKTRNLFKKSAYFWANFLQVDPEETKCLSKAYQKKHPTIWPY